MPESSNEFKVALERKPMRAKTRDALTEKAEAAFVRAAADVIQRARQTGTPVILWENGKIVERTADEAENQLLKKLSAQATPEATNEPK